MDDVTVDGHSETEIEDRCAGVPWIPVVSRALQGVTLQEVATQTNGILAQLRRTGATVYSVAYVRQEGDATRSSSYRGAVLYRPGPVPEAVEKRPAMGRLLSFRHQDADDALALLAHAVPVETPARSSRDERADDLRQQTAVAIGRLAEQLAEGHSAGFREYLAFMARFWEYSAHNSLLIHLQRPTATRCAGMRLWNQLGYTVRPGERGLWIWAPVLRRGRDEHGDGGEDEGERLVGFRPAVVFDAGQLAGIDERPLPAPVPPLPDDAHELLMTCLERVRAHGIAVTLRPLPSGTAGYANPGGITLDPEGDSRNRLFVLLHELAHMLGHVAPLATLVRSLGGDADAVAAMRREAEFEAESAAYAVAAIMGLEHPGARDYLLHYSASPEVLSRHLGAIQRLVQQMLRVLRIVDRPIRPGVSRNGASRRVA